ncbi:MAG: cyclic-di-AMP phosphodiesterase PgpH, partial [Chthoniobacter sp.]|nr:cyclic-di-AMP phosphodiesterase PgpH [Chthoniobacter sp.]
MFGFFEKRRLIRKGLASSKTRRRRSHSELAQAFETGVVFKVLIFAAFMAGLASLIFYGTQPQPTEKFLVASLIFLTALAQLWVNHPNSFASNSRIVLMFGSMLAHLGIAKLILVLARDGAISPQFGPLLLPYAFAPLVCSVLLGKNQGLYAATFVSLWGSVAVFRGIDAVYLVMSLICGFTAVFVTLEVRRRSRLIRAGVFVGLATWVLAIAFGVIVIPWERGTGIDWRPIALESLAAIGSGVMTAMIVGGALPVLETLFRVTTDISWLEAADLNHPLLKRLTIDAPGTYHHSLVVANLAEAAAEAIGANPTMSRVCSYFHDIGKLVKPEY